MKFLFPVFALFLFCKLCVAEEDFRTWTSSDGRKIQAKFIEMVGTRGVKIQNATGKEFTFPKSRISAADWKYVEKIVTEQKEKEAKPLPQLKEKEAKEELFRLPKSLSGKGCVIIASLKGNVRVFTNPFDSGFLERDLFDFSEIPNIGKSSKGNIPNVGDSIEVGGIIVTRKNSQATLLLTNGTLAILNENSRVILENLWQTPFKPSSTKVSDLKEEPSISRTSMELDFGELIVDVKKLNKSSSFLVHSPLGVAGIRGTKFRFSSNDNGTNLSVTEGLVEYLDPKRKIFKVGKGNSVTTQADEPSKQGKLNENEKIRIKSVISKASQSSASFDLKKLSDASKKSSQQKKIFFARSAKNLEMIWCPPGSYLRGDDSSNNTVILTKGFYLGKYEVTQEQYQYVMGKNPSPIKFYGSKKPVVMVLWDDAMAFCKKLNQYAKGIPEGWAFTLPTEAQWEYACRAGTTTKYSWGDNAYISDYAKRFGKSNIKVPSRTVPPWVVGSSIPNAWGFYDMHGNVMEWCADVYGKYPSGLLTDPGNSANSSSRNDRVIRSTHLGSASRHGQPPSAPTTYLGFRVVFQKK